MKIKMKPPNYPRRGSEVKVGNVYEVKSGKPGYFIVVAISPDGKWNNVVMLRTNSKGEIVRGLNEPKKYIQEHKDLVGFVELPDMEIKWFIDEEGHVG